MKIAIECKSPLLQKSLELFLSNHLSSSKSCDIFIKDQKCVNDDRCFYISSNDDADLMKPFSKKNLILALEKKYLQQGKDITSIEEESILDEEISMPDKIEEEKVQESVESDFSLLERRIELLTKEYQMNIMNTVKAFYEK